MIESVQIGLDLATAVSIIFAVLIFYRQSIESRESRREQFEEGEKSQLQSEMWGYFKGVADRISGFTIKLYNERRELDEFVEGIPEDEELINKDIHDISSNFSERARKAIDLSKDIKAYLLYDASFEVENLLGYYEFEQTKKDEILKGIDDSVKEIEKYIKQMRDFQGNFKIVDGVKKRDEESKKRLDEIIKKTAEITKDEKYKKMCYEVLMTGKSQEMEEGQEQKTQDRKLQILVGSQIGALRKLLETKSTIAPEPDSDNKQASEKQQNAPDSDNEKKVVFIGLTLMKLRQNLLKAIK